MNQIADARPHILREYQAAGLLTKDEPEPLRLVWFDEIEPVLDARDFVQGVLVEGGAAVVYGESNAGKTFWITDLALHVAARLEWNGRRVEQGGVVYCVLEGGHGFNNRVAAWKEERGLHGQKIPFAAIPSSMNLLRPDADTPRLIEAIEAAAADIGGPVKLVVIDTLSRALAGGNENSPEDMGALVMNMDAIRAATGACVVFVHHTGKDSARGARGHSLLRAAIETEIEVVADKDGETKTATVVKQRDLPKGDVFGFTLESVELGRNRHGEPVTTCLVRPSLAVAAARKDKRLHPEAESLKREVHSLIASEGQTRRPMPDMPLSPTVTKERLRTFLIQSGWLQVSTAVSGTETVPKPELTRLWKRLDALKTAEILGFNKDDVWLAKR